MDASEPASPAVPHAPNHDSMVTVSLSDIQSNSEHTQPDWRTLDIPPTPVESSHESSEANQTRSESFGPMALQDAAKTAPIPLDEPSTPTTAEDQTVDEEADSEVDWENLEKTEEQEPRGEGSDDVGDRQTPKLAPGDGMEINILFLPVNGLTSRSIGTGKQCSGNEPQIRLVQFSSNPETPATIPLAVADPDQTADQ